jgi:glycosyltransferase involved in cell wall biosynthesis
MTTALVDIVCTFLDAEATLGATLDSLAAQTEPDLRVTMVDDGSSDGGPAIAAERAACDHRFRLETSPVKGRGHALNFGARLGTAPLIAIMDADDIAHERWIEDAVAGMAARPELAAMGFGRMMFGRRSLTWPAPSQARITDVTRLLGRTNPLCHSGSIYRRAAFEAVEGYDVSRSSNFDYDYWVRLAANGHKLGQHTGVRVAKRYHFDQKFAFKPGFERDSMAVQARAIRTVTRSPVDWLRLAARAARMELRRHQRHRARDRFLSRQTDDQ